MLKKSVCTTEGKNVTQKKNRTYVGFLHVSHSKTQMMPFVVKQQKFRKIVLKHRLYLFKTNSINKNSNDQIQQVFH